MSLLSELKLLKWLHNKVLSQKWQSGVCHSILPQMWNSSKHLQLDLALFKIWGPSEPSVYRQRELWWHQKGTQRVKKDALTNPKSKKRKQEQNWNENESKWGCCALTDMSEDIFKLNILVFAVWIDIQNEEKSYQIGVIKLWSRCKLKSLIWAPQLNVY